MAENEEWELQHMTEETDEYYNPLLDDLDMTTLMEEGLNSESELRNGQ